MLKGTVSRIRKRCACERLKKKISIEFFKQNIGAAVSEIAFAQRCQVIKLFLEFCFLRNQNIMFLFQII